MVVSQRLYVPRYVAVVARFVGSESGVYNEMLAHKPKLALLAMSVASC